MSRQKQQTAKTEETKEPKYITPARLKGERGWTQSLIKKFLPEPDKTAANPHYRSGPEMRLYSIVRVKEIESTQEWQAAFAKASLRRQSAEKAVETKFDKMVEHLENVRIEVPVLSQDELIERACNHYNQFKQSQAWGRDGYEDFARATPTSDERFLQRISVNYLRHCLSKYEDELRTVAGRVGVDFAYVEINKRVCEAISEAYPFLSAECDLQQRKKGISTGDRSSLWNDWRQRFESDEEAIASAVWITNEIAKKEEAFIKREFYAIKDCFIEKYQHRFVEAKLVREEISYCFECLNDFGKVACLNCDGSGIFRKRNLYIHSFGIAGQHYNLYSYVTPATLSGEDAESEETYEGHFTAQGLLALALPFPDMLRMLEYVRREGFFLPANDSDASQQ